MSNPLSFTVTATGLSEALQTIGANQADTHTRLLLLENRQRDSERQARETENQHRQQSQQCETRLTELLTTLSATISTSQQQSQSEARLTDHIATLSTKIDETARTHSQQPPSDSPLNDLMHSLLKRLDCVEGLFRDLSHRNGIDLPLSPHIQQAYSEHSQNILPNSNHRWVTVSSDTMALGSPFTYHGLTDTEDDALPAASLSTLPRIRNESEPVQTRPSLVFPFKLPPQRLEGASASTQEDYDMDCRLNDDADENADSVSDDQSGVDMVPARQPGQAANVSAANRPKEWSFRDQGEDAHLSHPHVRESLHSLNVTRVDADPEIEENFDNIQIASHQASLSLAPARNSITRNHNPTTNDHSIKNFKVRTHADQVDGRGVSNDLKWLHANAHLAGVKEGIQGLTRSQAKRQRDVEDQDDTFVRPQARRPRPQSQPVHGPRRVFVENQQQTEELQSPAQVQTQTEGVPLQQELPRNQSRSQPPEGQRRSNRHHVSREPMNGMIGTPDFGKTRVCKRLNLE